MVERAPFVPMSSASYLTGCSRLKEGVGGMYVCMYVCLLKERQEESHGAHKVGGAACLSSVSHTNEAAKRGGRLIETL